MLSHWRARGLVGYGETTTKTKQTRSSLVRLQTLLCTRHSSIMTEQNSLNREQISICGGSKYCFGGGTNHIV